MQYVATLWLHTTYMLHKRRYAITFVLYDAACPSLLPDSTMGEINLLVSHIPASVSFLSEKDSKTSLTSHNSI